MEAEFHCILCKTFKPSDCFTLHVSMRHCNECVNPKQRTDRTRQLKSSEEYDDRQLRLTKRWRRKNPDNVKLSRLLFVLSGGNKRARARYRKKNLQRTLDSQRKYRNAHPERVKAAYRRWSYLNQDYFARYLIKYMSKHPDALFADQDRVVSLNREVFLDGRKTYEERIAGPALTPFEMLALKEEALAA